MINTITLDKLKKYNSTLKYDLQKQCIKIVNYFYYNNSHELEFKKHGEDFKGLLINNTLYKLDRELVNKILEELKQWKK